MINFPMLPGIDVNLFALAFISIGAGILSGFAGVGGAFIMMPALIILGFPAHFAVGTSLNWVMGNSIIGALRHGRLGNVDVKLGMVIIVAMISGVEVGVRIVNWAKGIGLAEEIVLSISICMLLVIGAYTLSESIKRKQQLDKMLKNDEKHLRPMRITSLSQKLQGINIPPMLNFTKSGVTVSLWIVLALGFLIGMIGGVIGVGGGFVMVPALVYLLGLPPFIAVGTGLFQMIFSSAYGAVRHTMSGNVIIFASVLMVIMSSIGIQIGVLATRYVRGVSVRFVLGVSVLMTTIAAILKLLSNLLENMATWFDLASLAVIFSTITLAVTVVLVLFIMAMRYRQGQHVPTWVESVVFREDNSP